MGCVYFRQEKYDVALCHFRSAASIAPGSSVLHCYLGMTLQRQGCHEQALAKLQVSRELSWGACELLCDASVGWARARPNDVLHLRPSHDSLPAGGD